MTLLLESAYSLNKNLSVNIYIGISFENDFQVVIYLKNEIKKRIMSLNKNDFHKIFSEKETIFNFFYEISGVNLLKKIQKELETVSLLLYKKTECKVLKISKENSNFVLDNDSAINLLRLENVIKQKVSLLESLDVKNYYTMCLQRYVLSLKLNKCQTLHQLIENDKREGIFDKLLILFIMEVMVFYAQNLNKDVSLALLYSKKK